ncbi:MAG: alpha/beta hydrolase family protein [Bacteroidota bacterium]
MYRILALFLGFGYIQVSSQIPEELPQILSTDAGKKISDVDTWENRRKPEILDLFRDEVYGWFPADFKPEVSFEKVSTDYHALNGEGIRKQIIIHVKNPENDKQMKIPLLIYLPSGEIRDIPVFLGLNFYGNHTIHADPGIMISDSWVRNNVDFQIEGFRADERSRGVRNHRWPVEYILSRGYGLATMYYGDIDPDYDDDFQNGLHNLFREDGPYPEDGAGSIAAWAYGLSLAMDYMETDTQIDENKIAVLGHSRLGKTALWAGARDTRFAMVISNNSGCGGAALSLRKQGETVQIINDRFPHWFNDNFIFYNENETELPVDQHMLLATIAPRFLYVTSAEKDGWADPYGEQLSTYLAGKVWEKIYNQQVYVPREPRPVNYPVKRGYVGYHIRSGKHDITPYDWEQFLDFADLKFRKKSGD